MNHLTEEELILHYYGEEEGDSLAAEQHLEECETCREFYGSLQRVLNVVDSLPVPDPGPEYAARVWRGLEPALPRRRFPLLPRLTWRLAFAGAAFAALMVAAFVAGRFYPRRPGAAPQMAAATDNKANQKVLLVAVGDHLERSQMVLFELTNANPNGPLDITAQQERAGDLIGENRLYMQTAAHTGDTVTAGVLEELERVLLDITHAPSRMSPRELETMRQRLEAEGILFKIRVIGDNVRHQEESAGRQKL
jgi:hypothetical protein